MMSRQSDSNRRPADYKTAALDQLSYAGAFLGKLRVREAHTTLFRTERNLIISVRPTRVFGNADHSVADRTLDRAGGAQESAATECLCRRSDYYAISQVAAASRTSRTRFSSSKGFVRNAKAP